MLLSSYLGQSGDNLIAELWDVIERGQPVSVSAELYHNEYIIDITDSFTGPVSYEKHQTDLLNIS